MRNNSQDRPTLIIIFIISALNNLHKVAFPLIKYYMYPINKISYLFENVIVLNYKKK